MSSTTRSATIGKAVLTAGICFATLGSLPAAAATPVIKTDVGSAVPMAINTALVATHDRIVADAPVQWTPQISDGKTSDVTQVGSAMVVGGLFDEIQQRGGAPISQPNVFSFDASDGTINTAFAPQVDGEVRAVEEGPTPGTVFVAGGFGGIDGQGGKIFLLNTSDGSIVSSFSAPPLNGAVNDLALVDDRLYVGGYFTRAAGQTRNGLVQLDANTGVVSSVLTVGLTENHNYTGGDRQARGAVGAKAIAVDPVGDTLAVIGNFRKADGLARDQMVLIDTTGGQAQVRADWRTRGYEAGCATRAFDSYVRDVAFSPDGTYVNVATTGGPFPGTLCDTGTRWDIAQTGDDVQPDWTDVTGGDTLLSAASSGAAVYFGGHQRWMNNNTGRDFASPGAVPRPGLAGVDVDNGVPLSWNPGRNPRGVGAEVVEVTEDGLWVGSDTLFIGNFQQRRPRLAFFPLAGGEVPAASDTRSLPSNVYLASGSGEASDASGLSRLFYEGGQVASDAIVEDYPAGGLDWSTVRGAVVIDGYLYYATTGGAFFRRAFTDGEYGEEEVIDPYNDRFWSDINSGRRNVTYRGVQPSFYSQIDSLTGMSYQNKRLYYTRSDSDQLFSRGFVPDDAGVMTQDAQTDPAFSQPDVGGIFFDPDGNTLFFANTETGTLSSIGWDGTAVQGSATVVSGPDIDGMDWRTRALFVGPGDPPVPNEAPTAEFILGCDQLECTFDGTASSDDDGSISSYVWDFGDGATAQESLPTHTFGAAGSYDVTLTVTDNDGSTDSQQQTIEVLDIAIDAPELVASASANGSGRTATLTLPDEIRNGDLMVLFVTTNQDSDPTGPTGVGDWDQESRESNGPMAVSVYSRVADGSEAGKDIEMTYPGSYRSDITVAAYRGVGPDGIEDIDVAEVVRTNEHTTGEVGVGGNNRRALSFWADRSSSTTAWTAPPEVSVVSESYATGSGRVTSLLGEASANLGSYGGLIATTDADSSRGIAYTVTLQPGRGQGVPNRAPEAVISAPSCALLVCEFSGAESSDSDADDSIAEYSWDFGDGSAAQAGEEVSHDFRTAGTYSVELTVTDEQGATNTAIREVQVSDVELSAPTLVGESGVNLRSSAPVVELPSDIDSGDLLLLFVTTNKADQGDAPTGVGAWQEERREVNGPLAVTVYSRLADGSEGGRSVEVALPEVARADLTALAYRGVGDDAVEVIDSSQARSTATHTTPTVTSPGNDRRAVSVWADRSSTTTDWTAPDGVTVVSNNIGSGGGRVTTLITEDVAVAGTYGGLGATTNDVSARSATFTLLLAPGEAAAPSNPAPVAKIAAPACEVLVCSFDGSDSSGSGAGDAVADYAWDFGDGSSGTGASVSHEFAEAGVYTVGLTITDNSGATDSTTVDVTVNDAE